MMANLNVPLRNRVSIKEFKMYTQTRVYRGFVTVRFSWKFNNDVKIFNFQKLFRTLPFYVCVSPFVPVREARVTSLIQSM